VASRDAKLTLGTIAKVLLWFVYVWVVLNLVLLFLAFVLRLFGANPDAGFTQWVYRSVTRSMAPFRGIFEPIVISDQSVLDTSLLFAMIIYGLVALLLSAGIAWVTEFLMRRRRQIEQEVWDDRLEVMSTGYPPAGGSPRAPAPPAQSTYPSPFDQPPPR
jgi:ABC-type Fe3+ transport system permease subunit